MMYQMELTMARDEGEAKGKAEGEAKGEARGIVQGKRDALFRLLERRGIDVTEAQRLKIGSCTTEALLDQWFDQALTAESADDIDV